jgi:hypothetical protein
MLEHPVKKTTAAFNEMERFHPEVPFGQTIAYCN